MSKGIFQRGVTSGSVFSSPVTIFLINLGSHRQLRLSKLRDAARHCSPQSSTMVSFVILVAMWHVQTREPVFSAYCCSLVFISKLITWVRLIFYKSPTAVGQWLSHLCYRALGVPRRGHAAAIAGEGADCACPSLGPTPLLCPTFTQSNSTLFSSHIIFSMIWHLLKVCLTQKHLREPLA